MHESLFEFLRKPELYEPGEAAFWNDPHISKGMLEAHLAPSWDAASRKHDFIDRSVSWISSLAPKSSYPSLIDLGCGPGLYTSRFSAQGYKTTGIDISSRSTDYAVKASLTNYDLTDYRNENYLLMTDTALYDIALLIFCDYGVLSTEQRGILMNNAFRALRPGGLFFVDVFTSLQHMGKGESNHYEFCGEGGFWSEAPYLRLSAFYRYDFDNTVLTKDIIITEKDTKCYHIWDHCFTADSLKKEGESSGFAERGIFEDVSGSKLRKKSKTLCFVFEKPKDSGHPLSNVN